MLIGCKRKDCKLVCHYNFLKVITHSYYCCCFFPVLFGTDGDEFVRSNTLKGLLLLITWISPLIFKMLCIVLNNVKPVRFLVFLFVLQLIRLQAIKNDHHLKERKPSEISQTCSVTVTYDVLLLYVPFLAKLIIFWFVCHPDEEKPQVGNITISDMSWDSFSVSWELDRGEVEGFLVEVSDPDGLSDGQNHTLSSQEFSLAVTDLSPSTFYRVTLYGLYKGELLDPVFAEAITGINSCPILDQLGLLFQFSLDQMLCLKQQNRLTSFLFWCAVHHITWWIKTNTFLLLF